MSKSRQPRDVTSAMSRVVVITTATASSCSRYDARVTRARSGKPPRGRVGQLKSYTYDKRSLFRIAYGSFVTSLRS